MKNNRLFGIIYLLLTNEMMRAKELAEHFEVSTRTIYRDIETLSEINIPIYMSRGKNGGIGLLENYKLDKALLNDEEQKQLLFSLQELNKLKLGSQETMDKMKALFSKQDEDWFEVDFSVWGNSYHHKINFDLIKAAILNQKVIEFSYFNSYGTKTERCVEPFKLIFKHNAWYIYGWDRTKQATRLFKVTRIRDLQSTDIHFDRTMIATEKNTERPPKMIRLILEIDSTYSYRILDEFEESSIKVLENGNFLIDQQFPFTDWIFGFILSFSDHNKVIEPDFVREEIIKRLQNSLKQYR